MTYTTDHPRYLCTCGDIKIVDNDGMEDGQVIQCFVCLDRFTKSGGLVTVHFKYPPVRKEA